MVSSMSSVQGMYNMMNDPNQGTTWSKKSCVHMEQRRDNEAVELDIGSSLLWCKFCGRTKCPLFKNKAGKEYVLKQVYEHYNAETNRTMVDVFDPETRHIFLLVGLSHVGCRSFSEVDQQEEDIFNDPDYLEIV